MRCDNLSREGETHAMAALFGAFVQLKNLDSFGHANTTIANLKHNGPLYSEDFERQLPAQWHRLLSVLAKISDDLLYFQGIQAHPRQRAPPFEIDNNASRSTHYRLQSKNIVDKDRHIGKLPRCRLGDDLGTILME